MAADSHMTPPPEPCMPETVDAAYYCNCSKCLSSLPCFIYAVHKNKPLAF